MFRLEDGLRVLAPADLPKVFELLDTDPVVNVFVAHRAQNSRLDPRWLGGQIWGYFDQGALTSLCHSASNLVPVLGTDEALLAFARRAEHHSRSCATLVGPADQVAKMWDYLSATWSPPRDERWNQPHLEIDHSPLVRPDTSVRVSDLSDLDVLYPACVAMYSEEVGVSPEIAGGASMYRARITQLINRGWSLASYDDHGVAFKAEIACATAHAAQVQGVWVRPDLRGRGLAAPGMAAVVQYAREHIAPVVSLYVNEHNLAARRTYERVGFRQTATFATLMF